jgi:hypothetical protein
VGEPREARGEGGEGGRGGGVGASTLRFREYVSDARSGARLASATIFSPSRARRCDFRVRPARRCTRIFGHVRASSVRARGQNPHAPRPRRARLDGTPSRRGSVSRCLRPSRRGSPGASASALARIVLLFLPHSVARRRARANTRPSRVLAKADARAPRPLPVSSPRAGCAVAGCVRER